VRTAWSNIVLANNLCDSSPTNTYLRQTDIADDYISILASCPADFKDSGDIAKMEAEEIEHYLGPITQESTITNIGISICQKLLRKNKESNRYIALLPCKGGKDQEFLIALLLQRISGTRFARMPFFASPRLFQIAPALTRSGEFMEFAPERVHIATEPRRITQSDMCAVLNTDPLRDFCQASGIFISGYGTIKLPNHILNWAFYDGNDSIYIPGTGLRTLILLRHEREKFTMVITVTIRTDLCEQEDNSFLGLRFTNLFRSEANYEVYQSHKTRDALEALLSIKSMPDEEKAGFVIGEEEYAAFIQFKPPFDGSVLLSALCEHEPDWSSPYSEPPSFRLEARMR